MGGRKKGKRSRKVKNSKDLLNEYLTRIYYDTGEPGTYGGVSKLWDTVKLRKDRPKQIDFKKVKAWLEDQEVYQMHKVPGKDYKTEPIIVAQVNEQWDADLMILSQYAKYNKGYRYAAVFIDLFSRYLWVEPMKTKTAKDMLEVIKKVFEEGRKPNVLRTDQGTEWKNKPVDDYLEKQKVTHFIAYSPWHAGYAERVQRTLKNKMFRYFSHNRTYDWVSVIDDIVDSYNGTKHSSIKMKPKDVTIQNEQQIYEKFYLPKELKAEKQKIVYKFNVGDKVRLSHARGVFDKGYMETFTREVFQVAAHLPTYPVRYRIKDLNEDLILGSFYQEELIPAKVDEDTLYAIEKVLSYKTIRGKKMALVKWENYSDKFNSYVPVKDIQHYK